MPTQIFAHRLGQSDLPTETSEAILYAGVQSLENSRTREEWAKLLADEHGVHRFPSPTTKKPAVLRRLVYTLSAAAAILLIVASFFLMGAPSGNELLATELERIEITNTRSLSEHLAEERQTFYTAFREGEFDLAARAGSAIVADEGANSLDLLNHGLAQLRAEQLPAAAATFAGLLAKDPTYRIEATFYSGVTALKSGKVQRGKDWLRQIPEEQSGKYYDRAAELLSAGW